MAKLKETDYFGLFVKAIECSCKAATMLKDTMSDYKADEKEVAAIHEVENEGDKIYHELVQALNVAFITPIEREDILHLAQAIDEVTDSIEDIAVRMHMYNITVIRKEAKEFLDLIVKNCETIKKALIEFRNFKKSKVLNDYVIQINHYEEQGDEIYRRAVRRLFIECEHKPIEILRWRAAFENMEQCCDACEDVADVIESVIMKNS